MSDEMIRDQRLVANTAPLRLVVQAVALQLSQVRGDSADAYSEDEIQAATERLLAERGRTGTPVRAIDAIDVDTLHLALTVAGRVGARDSMDRGFLPAGRDPQR